MGFVDKKFDKIFQYHKILMKILINLPKIKYVMESNRINKNHLLIEMIITKLKLKFFRKSDNCKRNK